MKKTTLPEAMPHGQIKEVFKDVFFVTGEVNFFPGLPITRNMIIIRQKIELTLINFIRLSNQGMMELENLGTIKNIIRIGDLHHLDIPFYKYRYNATYWTLEHANGDGDIKPDKILYQSDDLPFDDAKLIIIKTQKCDEAAILLDHDGGILITCDCIQNHESLKNHKLFERFTIRINGTCGKAKISRLWLMHNHAKYEDLNTILKYHFKHLLSAHGTPLFDSARKCLKQSIKNH